MIQFDWTFIQRFAREKDAASERRRRSSRRRRLARLVGPAGACSYQAHSQSSDLELFFLPN